MNDKNDYKILELDHPHGFLIWRGKQSAVGTPESLPVGEKLLVVSEGEAFGHVTLKAPAQMKASEFDREEYHKEHRLYPTEWRLSWPDIKALNLYRFESWEPFEKALPFENGEIVADEPTPHEAALIEKSRYLPKTLVLDDEAVTMTGGKFTVADGLRVPDDLKQILQTTYETEVEFVADKQSKYLPLYRLALVRVPNMRVKKNEGEPLDSGAEATGDGKVKVQQDDAAVTASVKQEMHMPWEKVRDHADCPSDEPIAVVKTDTGEVEGCHANEEEANAQLAALNASEDGEAAASVPIESDNKQESLQQRLSRISQQFHDTFADMEDDEGCCDRDLWVVDVFDAFIVANDSGDLFRVNYMDTEAGVIFAPMDTWVVVEVGYNPKGFTLLARNEPPKKERSWKDKLREAAKTVMDFVQRADYESKEQEPEPMNLTFDFNKPFGIAVKNVNGEPWHFSWSTNAFRDRDGEIFTTKALENFVIESEQNGYKGFFNLWHIEGTDFAVKEWKAVVGRFLVEAGPYLDNEAGKRAKAFFQEYPDGHPEIAPEGWGASPEFRFLPEERAKDGIFHWLWITRTSTLPRAAAANIWTKGMSIMAMTRDQEQAAIAAFGKDFVENLKLMAEKETAALEQVADHKAAESPEESEEKATEAEQAEDKPEETEAEEERETEDSESDNGEAVPVINVPVEELAAEVKKQFEFDLQPVADAMAEILKEVKAVSDRVTKLEKHEAVKKQVETPRFLLNLVRASEAEETALAEKDELKDKRPQEAKVKSDGTLMGNFFPGPK